MIKREGPSSQFSSQQGVGYLFLGVIVISVLAVGAVIFLMNRSRTIEEEFNEKKAVLIKEGLDLKDQLKKLEAVIRQKTEELAAADDHRKMIQEQMDSWQRKAEQVSSSYEEMKTNLAALESAKAEVVRQIDLLKKENAALQEKISNLNSAPLVRRIENAIAEETNPAVKKILGDALQNVMLLEAGKPVRLDSIVVNKKFVEASSSVPVVPGSSGKILSAETKDNLIIIDLGRKDQIQINDVCSVLNDKDEPVASGDVIGVRYDTSAVFIDKINSRYDNNILKVGGRVAITKP